MLNIHRGPSLLLQFRRFSLAQVDKKNHYDTLGITPHATVTEIKKAYYNLSMIYHPDKTDGSVESLEKFRSVTEAYEVLSNLSSKRLYDKGVLKEARPVAKKKPTPKKKTIIVPKAGLRTPVYNFDMWTKSHYRECLERRTLAKQKFENLRDRDERTDPENKAVVVVACLLFAVGVSWMFVLIANPNLDLPKPKKK